jgi:hypothetical protein
MHPIARLQRGFRESLGPSTDWILLSAASLRPDGYGVITNHAFSPAICYHSATGCRRTQPGWLDALGKKVEEIMGLRPALAFEFGRDLSLKFVFCVAYATAIACGL